MGDFSAELQPPKTPDYYADLGLQQTATSSEIKRAHHTLAKKYHPDKLGPGVCADAHEFRKIREAFECLRNATSRSRYDARYLQVRREWHEYRELQKFQQRVQELRQAEEAMRRRRAEEARRVFEEKERERVAREKAARQEKVAEEREARRRVEAERVAREREVQEKLREQKEAQAEQRSREVARKAREQQAAAARERLRKEKEQAAHERSEEAGRKAREARKQAAVERLQTLVREEKQSAIRDKWATLRNEAENRRKAFTQANQPSPRACDHFQLDWLRKKGRIDCSICNASCAKFSFCCAQCGTLACQACKTRLTYAK